MQEKILISKKGEFTDTKGNVIQLRGVNLDPSVKIPFTPFQSTHCPIIEDNLFKSAPDVSFINHPLPLDKIEEHINRIKSLGYNTIRFPFTWEALEHEGPGKYDYEYMDYVIQVLQKINILGGIYVYPVSYTHLDVYKRQA